MNKNTSRRGRLSASAAAGVLLAGLMLGTTACSPTTTPVAAPQTVQPTQQQSTPKQPTPTPSATSTTPPPAAPTKAATRGPIMDESVPVSLQVPEIGIDTSLVPLGQEEDGTMTVPGGQPGDPGGWYKYSPTPGQLGPAVILGHVNNLASPEGLFYRLHEMKPGQQFTVARADGSTAVFEVDKLIRVKKATFPTLAVYGNTDRAEIRLITCGGFDASSGDFTENTVVYGHLISSRK